MSFSEKHGSRALENLDTEPKNVLRLLQKDIETVVPVVNQEVQVSTNEIEFHNRQKVEAIRKSLGLPEESVFEDRKTGRMVDGSPWTTLDTCPRKIVEAAEMLDETSFPDFLTDDHYTKNEFTWLLNTFREDQVIFLDDSGEKVLGTGFSAPIHLDENLPENGWEGAVHQIISDHREGKEPNALVAFSASVSPDASGQKMGDKILNALVQRAKELGLSKLIVPARPTGKSNYPDLSMEEYDHLRDQKTGEHIDPWIRAHQRQGGRVIRIGKNSHIVRSPDGSWPSVVQWERWTGMKFPKEGEYAIPRGNAKLSIHDGIGEYREECLWIEYDLSNPAETQQYLAEAA